MTWNDSGLCRLLAAVRILSFGISFFLVDLRVNACPDSVYLIGNSFTWDAQPNQLSTDTQYPQFLNPVIGWSVYSGKSLTYIVSNPDKSVAEGEPGPEGYFPDPVWSGNYETDLAARPWEAITMQPHTYDGGLHLDTEIVAAGTIIAKALETQSAENTTFYIYGPWAFQEGPDRDFGRTYSENWLSGYSENQINSALLPNVRQAFRSLYLDSVIDQNPSVTIKWIPVGEVVYRLDQELQNGAIPELTGAWDLFDEPGVHLHDPNPDDGFEGRYVAHITTLCTIWGYEPSAFHTQFEDNLDPDFKALVDSVVWATILDFYPDITPCKPETNLVRHPGLPGELLKSDHYSIQARLGSEEAFQPTAVMAYATNFGEDPLLNDPFNIANPGNRDALADTSHWTSLSYGYNGQSLELEISLSSEEAITSCELYPGRYNIPVSTEDGKAHLSLYAPNRYLYLIINDDRENPLFIFVDPLEESPPGEEDDGVLYFGPGVHDIGKDFVFPEDKQTIYLALGSYVTGSILADGRSDISVRGRGILSGEGYGLDSEVNAAIHFKGQGTNQLIEGITSIRPLKYHLISRGTLHTKNVKCLSYNNTTDGIVAGDNSLTENCFFKVNDDVIKLYYDNQIVRDIVVYHQTNSPVLEFGWAGQASQNSLVERIDIVQDDSFGAEVNGQAILGWAHNNNAGGEQKGHVLEDIRAENGKKRLMHLNIDNAPGYLDIVCRNWDIQATEDTSDLFALAPGSIKIAFENVLVNQQPVQASEFENVGESDLQLSFTTYETGEPPVIQNQPQSSLVQIGDSVEMDVGASGLGALNFQWRKDGVPLPGASDSSFKIQDLQESAAGKYDVQVTTPFGTTTSNPAFITFTPLEQTLFVSPISDRSILDGPAALEGSSTSLLPVRFEVIGGPTTIEDQQLSFTGPGKVTIQVTQPGNDVWLPAPPVLVTFTVYSIVDTWRLETLGTYEDAGDAADLADPDYDRIPNLFEYFLGTSPMQYDQAEIFRYAESETGQVYQSVQSADSLDGIEVHFQMSTNLKDWLDVDQALLAVVEQENGDRQVMISTEDLEVPYFIRMQLLPL